MTRDSIRDALTDPVAIIATLYGEVRSESLEGIVTVGCVIRNRVLADLGSDQKPDWWGESFTGVCLARWQFSCWWEDSANSRAVYALAESLLEGQPIGNRDLIAELRWIADGLIENRIRDHAHGCDHYLTTKLLKEHPPAWTKGRIPQFIRGAHAFFKLNQT